MMLTGVSLNVGSRNHSSGPVSDVALALLLSHIYRGNVPNVADTKASEFWSSPFVATWFR